MLLQLIFSAIFGAIMGSFANCIGFRLFNDNIKITKSRSVCFNCFHKLTIFDLIPIISYIFLKGKCKYCKTKIPNRYLIVEIFLSVLFFITTLLLKEINIITILLWIIFTCLTIQSISDIRVMMSSDIIHIITFISTTTLSFLIDYNIQHITTMIVGVFVFFVLLKYIMWLLTKKNCLGFGDIKLFIILSVVFSIEEFIVFIGLSGFFGIIYSVYKLFLINKSNLVKNLKKLVFFRKKNEKKNYKLNGFTIIQAPFPFIPQIFLSFLFVIFFKIVKMFL